MLTAPAPAPAAPPTVKAIRGEKTSGKKILEILEGGEGRRIPARHRPAGGTSCLAWSRRRAPLIRPHYKSVSDISWRGRGGSWRGRAAGLDVLQSDRLIATGFITN